MNKNIMFTILAGVMMFTSALMLYTSCDSDVLSDTIPADDTYSNEIILTWNTIAYEAMGGDQYMHGLFAARMNTMMHIAMHDALNSVYPRYETYAYRRETTSADPIAAAASAAHTVLVANLPDQKSMLDEYLMKSLSGIKDGYNKTIGIRVGQDAGKAILEMRQNDNAGADPVGIIDPSDIPGVYQTVPPFDFIFAPSWVEMAPFALDRNDQFRSVPLPAMTSEVYTNDFNEVKETGSATSTMRSEDQSAYAGFWYELSEIGWNRAARIVAEQNQAGLMETARLFALLNMAQIDSYISGWDSKFHYNFWRPYTAITGAGNDSNPATIAEDRWESYMPTPPVQDYPSTHSALGNASAAVLAHVFGDGTAFTMTSNTASPSGSTRSFVSFSQAADENADSRVMAGIHFRFSCEAGQKLGDDVADWIIRNYMKPLN
jgi:hypothetical protein